MRETGLRLLYLAILFYAAFCAYLYLAQRSFLYFPTPETSLPQAERVALQADGETLRLWARPRDGPGAVIYFGGNGEDVAASFDGFAGAMPQRAIYLVNYRGYGGSTGTPSEAALFRDALAVYDWVRGRHAEIAVIGSSLGTGVAVYLASARKVDRLVLVTPFDSIASVAQDKLRLFPIAMLLTDKFDSVSRIQDVSAKTLILIAEQDEMIPRARTDALIAKFPPGQARVEVIPGATHNSISLHPAYLKLIAAFL
jgi:hypothetical protein